MENSDLTRRNFIKKSTSAGVYAITSPYLNPISSSDAFTHPVRIGFVGVGSRGTNMLKVALSLEGVEIPAICDIDAEKVARAQRLVERAGKPKPKGFTGVEDYKRLAELKNLDAVYTATPVNLHSPIMLAAMRAGKYGATEMPACTDYDQAWELVETSEKTGKPCMLMENRVYQRNLQMILVMTRLGIFGDLTHCECGYQHDVRHYNFGSNGELLWRAYMSKKHNGNLYPTHPIGPIAQWININRGNRFEYLVSMSSRSVGLNYYAAKKFGPDSPGAKIKYAEGDVNTSLIQTSDGITVNLYYDTKNPRPYEQINRIQGTKGIYSGTLNKIYLEDISPKPHQWEEIDKYQEKYEHPRWKEYGDLAMSTGHGGADYFCLRDFVLSIRNRSQVPVDVYDAVTWSIITKLTEESVANKSRPVDFPDFTRGKWKTRKPITIEKI